jgi:hypothetical protein
MYDRLHENCFQNGKLHPFTDDECLRSYSKNDIRAVFPEFDEASKIDTAPAFAIRLPLEKLIRLKRPVTFKSQRL